MNKKMIAVFAAVTIIFVCVFASCEKEDETVVYADGSDYALVTDENGEKVLAEDGQLLVYATDEDGDFIEDENGERVTQIQQFVPIEEDGVVEDYGFKIELPEGWETTDDFGVFFNKEKEMTTQISIVKYFYDDYYKMNYDFYETLKKEGKSEGIEVEWKDELDFGDEFKGACRFTMRTSEGVSILYLFENSDNVYKVLITGADEADVIKEGDQFCKAMKFKGFTYYDDITAVSEEEATE